PAANTGSPDGWKPSLSATSRDDAGSQHGAMTRRAKPARHRGCALSRASCRGGIARSINCLSARQRSSMSSISHSQFGRVPGRRRLLRSHLDLLEGKGPMMLGANGYSRDGKPRNPQVLVGLVLIDGWPIAHHVFPGNWRDANTVPVVLRDLD